MRSILALLVLLLAACTPDDVLDEPDLLALHWLSDPEMETAVFCLLPDGTPIPIEPEPLVGTDRIASARVEAESDSSYAIVVSFDSAGAGRLEEVTTAGVGRRLAIVLEGTAEAVPYIVRPIDTGELAIPAATRQVAEEFVQRLNLAIAQRAP